MKHKWKLIVKQFWSCKWNNTWLGLRRGSDVMCWELKCNVFLNLNKESFPLKCSREIILHSDSQQGAMSNLLKFVRGSFTALPHPRLKYQLNTFKWFYIQGQNLRKERSTEVLFWHSLMQKKRGLLLQLWKMSSTRHKKKMDGLITTWRYVYCDYIIFTVNRLTCHLTCVAANMSQRYWETGYWEILPCAIQGCMSDSMFTCSTGDSPHGWVTCLTM